jgi:hypothetical protein
VKGKTNQKDRIPPEQRVIPLLAIAARSFRTISTMGRPHSNHSTEKRSPGSSSNTGRTISTSGHDVSQRRRAPMRSRSENANIPRPSQSNVMKRPPARGRSHSPAAVLGRRAKPPEHPQRGNSQSPFHRQGPPGRSKSMDRQGNIRGPPMGRSGHKRGPPMNRSGHSRGPPVNRSAHSRRPPVNRSGHSRGPPVNRSAHSRGPPVNRSGHSRSGYHVDSRSAHSRSGHTTIYNSRHSRSGDLDRSGHSSMSRSGHSKASMGSRPSLADQRVGKNRGRTIYQSLRNATKRQFPWSKFCSYFVPIIVLIASAIGLLVATDSGQDAATETPVENESVKPVPAVEDPFDGGKSPPKWPSDGNGLKVRILNALDESWNDVFGMVIEDWEYGNPDAVSVSVEKSSAETDCTSATGSVKVCSGDYGDTNWRGMSEFQLDGSNNIASVTVKMNDFHLKSMSNNVRQYTLCHEIGMYCFLQIRSKKAAEGFESHPFHPFLQVMHSDSVIWTKISRMSILGVVWNTPLTSQQINTQLRLTMKTS